MGTRAGSLIVLCAAAALAGCAGAGPPAAAPATTGVPAVPSSAVTGSPTTAVPESLRFTAKTVDGGTFDGASLAGRPAVLWFWAAWCPRCFAAAPNVAAVQREFTGKVSLVGVAGLESGADEMRRFVANRKIDGFPNLADDQGVVWRKFGVTTQEYYVILDAGGKPVYKGPLTTDDLRRRVAALAG